MRTVAATLLACLLGVTSAPAPGQTAQDQRVRTAPDTIAGVTFSDVPYRVESLGLSLRLPVGATVSSTATGDGVRSFLVSPEEKNWLLRVLAPRVADPAMDAPDLAESMIAEIIGIEADEAEGILARKNLRTSDGRKRVFDQIRSLQTGGGELTGVRFYVEISQPSGPNLVTGHTVFRSAPGQMIIFELNCLAPEFAKARPIYEAIVAQADVRDPAALASERAAGVAAGETVLADLDEGVIASHLPVGPEWRRLYRPGPTGRWSDDEEVAYQSLEIREGRRGELATARSKRSWTAADREQGFVARQLARYLEGDQRIDVMSLYWQSEDGERETWSVQMQITDRFDTVRWTETGVRQNGTINVTIAQPDGTVTEKAWPEPPTGYLTHIEALLLPRILAERGVEGEFAFYRYNTQRTDLSLRRDTLEATEDGWRLVTRAHEDSARETSELDRRGRIVTQTLGDDVHAQTMSQKDLLGIWRHKGLPIE
jgi:hypothetical protein